MPSRSHHEEAIGRDDFEFNEAGPLECRLEFGRLVEDLPDAETRAVIQPAYLNVALRRSMVEGSRRGIPSRVDEGEYSAGREPAKRQGKEVLEPLAVDVADPEAGEQAVDGSIRLGPGVADAALSVRPAAVSRARAFSSGSGVASWRVSRPRLARLGDHQPVPAASSTIWP